MRDFLHPKLTDILLVPLRVHTQGKTTEGEEEQTCPVSNIFTSTSPCHLHVLQYYNISISLIDG